MNCELCGKKTSKAKNVVIEGSTLQVCSECARHGKEVFSSKGGGTTKNEIIERINRKRRQAYESSSHDEEKKELVMDYSNRIRDARLDKNWTQEDLAKEMMEKKSVVAKLEHGDLNPSNELIAKLEHILEITLMEEVGDYVPNQSKKGQGITIGDLIREE
ncbi:MAG: multiprotein bridging factor aMBF1 [Thermoplasmata archaeon]